MRGKYVNAQGVDMNEPMRVVLRDFDTSSVERWHLWYDDYSKGTAFITEGSYSATDTPKIIAEDIPYDEGVAMVTEHNRGLPVPDWPETPEKEK